MADWRFWANTCLPLLLFGFRGLETCDLILYSQLHSPGPGCLLSLFMQYNHFFNVRPRLDRLFGLAKKSPRVIICGTKEVDIFRPDRCMGPPSPSSRLVDFLDGITLVTPERREPTHTYTCMPNLGLCTFAARARGEKWADRASKLTYDRWTDGPMDGPTTTTKSLSHAVHFRMRERWEGASSQPRTSHFDSDSTYDDGSLQ